MASIGVKMDVCMCVREHLGLNEWERIVWNLKCDREFNEEQR